MSTNDTKQHNPWTAWPTHPDGTRQKLGEMHSKDRQRIFNRVIVQIGRDFESIGARVEFAPAIVEDMRINPKCYDSIEEGS